MENGDHAHLMNVIDEVEKLRDGRHKNANRIEGLSGKVAALEVQVKMHDKLIWAAILAIFALLLSIASFYIRKYGVVP